MIFVAQLWKYNGERLENKNGEWKYLEETWILPNENKTNEGQAIRNSLGSVLKVDSNKGMHLKLKYNTILYSTSIYFHRK